MEQVISVLSSHMQNGYTIKKKKILSNQRINQYVDHADNW